MLGLVAVQLGAQIQIGKGIENVRRLRQALFDEVGQLRAVGLAATDIDRLDHVAAQLVLHGGHGAAYFVSQRLPLCVRAGLSWQAYGAHEDHVAVNQYRQIGILDQQIDQQTNPLALERRTPQQQRRRRTRSQHQPARI